MIRVAHVRDTYLRGTETFIYDIYKRHKGVEAVFLCERKRGADAFPADNVRSIEDRGSVYAGIQQFMRRCTHGFPCFTNEARHFGAQLIHAHFAPCGYFCLPTKRRLGIPLVTSFYGQDVFEFTAASRWRRRYRRLFDEGELFLALSGDMTSDLLGLGCPTEKIRVYRLGIDLTDFAPVDRPDRDPLTVLTIARLVEKKGIEYLIRAHARLRARKRPVRLRIVGDGPLEAELKTLAEGLGFADSVDFPGRVPFSELPRELAEADVFCLPSVTDRFGGKDEISMVIKEAMGTAMPFVATYHAGIPEVVTDDVNGLLVPERNDDALAEALDRLVQDAGLRRRLGLAGRELVERTWEIHRQVAVLESIYRDFVGA